MRDEVGGGQLRLCVPDVHNARILDAQLRLHLVQQLTANTIKSYIECQRRLKIHLYRCENESDNTSRWLHRESNWMFTFSSDKIKEKNSLSRSLSLGVN